MTSIRSRRQRSPPPGTPFNAGAETKFVAHWARGIASADVLQNTELLTSGGPTLDVAAGGVVLKTVSASSQYAYATSSPLGSPLAATQRYTLASCFVPSNTTTRGVLLACGSTASPTPYLWLEINAVAGKASYNTRSDGSGSETITSANTFTAGARCTAVAVSYARDSRKVIVNGDIANAGVGTAAYPLADTFTSNRFAIGAIVRDTISTFFDGSHLIQFAELRAWSDAEIVEFHRNPFARFMARRTMLPMYLPTASAFKPAWAKGINTVISAGARTA